jgi:oligopeptide/dipeptide ABC transporter ATP-binding protein
MYAGRIVESASTSQIFYEPKHPYNQALQKSIPALPEKGRTLYTIPGSPPNLSTPIPGCPFGPRCEYAREKMHHIDNRVEGSCARPFLGLLTNSIKGD